MKVLPIFLLFAILFASCKEKKQPTPKPVQQSLKWGKLQIFLDRQRLVVFKSYDSAFFSQWELKDSLIKEHPLTVVHIPFNTTDTTFALSPAEKDSLATYIYQIIIKPVVTDKRATDYVGNIEFTIIMDQTRLSCSYSSAGDWTTISEQTDKIYSLLKDKVKISRD